LSVQESNNNSLQGEITAKDEQLSELQQQLSQQQSLLGEKESSCQKLQQQLVSKNNNIEDLTRQLSVIKMNYKQLKEEKYNALLQENQKQISINNSLKQQIIELQAVAKIGEKQLNKWRAKIY
jgi:chromosome segregation ATPase